RLKDAVGQAGYAIAIARNAGEAFDMVVPWRQVVIADRPIDAVAVLLVGLEVLRSETVGLARPHQRLAAAVIAAHPLERRVVRRLVGLLVLLDPELLGGLVQGVANRFRLHRIA